MQSPKLAIYSVLILVVIGSLTQVYAAPSANLTLNSGQTSPAQSYSDSSGTALWQYITNPISTLLSKFIILYPSGLTHIRGYQFPDQNTTLAGRNTTQTFTGKQTFTPTATTAGTNLGTLGINPTSPRKGDIWIAGASIKFNDNTNTTQTAGGGAGTNLLPLNNTWTGTTNNFSPTKTGNNETILISHLTKAVDESKYPNPRFANLLSIDNYTSNTTLSPTELTTKGIQSDLFYGNSTKNATGTGHSFTALQIIYGSTFNGGGYNEHAGYTNFATYDNNATGDYWGTDFNFQSSKVQMGLMTGFSTFVNNYYNGQPALANSSEISIATRQHSGGQLDPEHTPRNTFPIDAGIKITGTSGCNSGCSPIATNTGFNNAIDIGGKGGQWQLDRSVIKNGIRIDNITNAGILFKNPNTNTNATAISFNYANSMPWQKGIDFTNGIFVGNNAIDMGDKNINNVNNLVFKNHGAGANPAMSSNSALQKISVNNPGSFAVVAGSLNIARGQNFYLDGGTNTYMTEPTSSNQLNIYISGVLRQNITAAKTIFPGNEDFGTDSDIFGGGSIIIRNPTATFADTLKTSSSTANQTLTLPQGTATLLSNSSSIADLGDVGGQPYSNNQVLTYQSSNKTWIAGAAGLGAAVTSINADTTAAQLIKGSSLQSNLTVNDNGATHTIKLGQSVLVVNGTFQNMTAGKKVSYNPTSTTAGIGIGTLSSSPTLPRRGDLWINGTTLGYNDNTNTTQRVANIGTANWFTQTQTFNTITFKNTGAGANPSMSSNSALQKISVNNPGSFAVVAGSLNIARGQNFYLDGGTNTYMTEPTSSYQFNNYLNGNLILNMTANKIIHLLNTDLIQNTLSVGSSKLILRNPASTFAVTTLVTPILKNQTLTNSYQPYYNFTSPANQTGTSSTTPVMLKAFATFIPRYSANATVTVSGYMNDTAATAGCRVDVRTSTSYLGNNGAVLSGTLIGTNMRMKGSSAISDLPFSKTVVATGLTLDTKNFFDLSFASTGTGTCTIFNVDWVIREQ